MVKVPPLGEGPNCAEAHKLIDQYLEAKDEEDDAASRASALADRLLEEFGIDVDTDIT